MDLSGLAASTLEGAIRGALTPQLERELAQSASDVLAAPPFRAALAQRALEAGLALGAGLALVGLAGWAVVAVARGVSRGR